MCCKVSADCSHLERFRVIVNPHSVGLRGFRCQPGWPVSSEEDVKVRRFWQRKKKEEFFG